VPIASIFRKIPYVSSMPSLPLLVLIHINIHQNVILQFLPKTDHEIPTDL